MVCFRLDLLVGTVSGMLELISCSLIVCVVDGYLLAGPVTVSNIFIRGCQQPVCS